jgi:hypothetical protein
MLCTNDAVSDFYKEHLTGRKIDQLIIDCKDGKIIHKINNMSKDIIRQNKVPGIKTYEVYRQNGGYASVEKAMKAMTLTKLLSESIGTSRSWWCWIPWIEMEFY